MISKGFYEQLETIAAERHIEIDDVLAAVKVALIKACQLEGCTGAIDVEFNHEQKNIRIYESFIVVDEIDPEGPEGQILLEQAKEIRARVRVGSEFRHEVKFTQIGRKGATRFKQIFIQGLKELGGKRAYEYFKEKEGEVVSAHIIKKTDSALGLNIGLDVITFMPIEEVLPGEKCEVGMNIKVCITKVEAHNLGYDENMYLDAQTRTKVEETGKGPKVFVSRSNKDLIKRLFEMYIPEVASGVIEVMAIAREPGSRTKVAVKSNNINVDAKGSCVGMQGQRVRQINEALAGERIDIFVWQNDPVQLIAQALTPARVISVLADPETKKSTVIVPDDQFSLAIGKGGQNVRLASLTTGWKIDIKDETAAYREEISFKPNVYGY